MVAGTWSFDAGGGSAPVQMHPFVSVDVTTRAALAEEAEQLTRHLSPAADCHEIVWPA